MPLSQFARDARDDPFFDAPNPYACCSTLPPPPPPVHLPLVWDWDIEHEDRRREAQADAVLHAAPPFQVDRRTLKDIVREKMGAEVVRIKFLSSGQSFLLLLVHGIGLMSPPSFLQAHSIK